MDPLSLVWDWRRIRLVWLGALALARWLPWCCGLDGEEEGGRGKRQSDTPGISLRKKALLSHSFFHLERHRENLDKKHLEENENDEGMGTGSAGKTLNVARHGQTCFCKLCFGVDKGSVAGSHSYGQTLGTDNVFLKFLLQLDCLM